MFDNTDKSGNDDTTELPYKRPRVIPGKISYNSCIYNYLEYGPNNIHNLRKIQFSCVSWCD